MLRARTHVVNNCFFVIHFVCNCIVNGFIRRMQKEVSPVLNRNRELGNGAFVIAIEICTFGYFKPRLR